MIDIYTNEIYDLLDKTIEERINNTQIKGISTDTRTIKVNQVFFAIKGPNFDGNKYVFDALKKGACLVITEEKSQDKKVICVENSIIALGLLAKYYRNKFQIPFISITGSVGKTSTKEMIKSVLNISYNVHSTIGNLNNNIGLPMTLFNMTKEHEISVIEMGMNNFNEIDYLSNVLEPTIGVLTNIGVSHIGILGSRKNILKAKLEMLNHMKKGSIIYINGDDDLLITLKNRDDFRFISFGFNTTNDIVAYDYQYDNNNKCSFKLENEKYEINEIGKHNVYNVLPAIILAKQLKIPYTKIQEGINNFKNEKMRMNIIIKGNYTIINDAYNANTQSMKIAIDVLKTYKKRKVAILGDMLELGKFTKKSHIEIGEYLANNSIDIIIAVGKEAINYKEGAIRNGFSYENIYIFNNINQLKEKINDIIYNHDIILLKGSRSSKMEEVIELIKI